MEPMADTSQGSALHVTYTAPGACSVMISTVPHLCYHNSPAHPTLAMPFFSDPGGQLKWPLSSFFSSSAFWEWSSTSSSCAAFSLCSVLSPARICSPFSPCLLVASWLTAPLAPALWQLQFCLGWGTWCSFAYHISKAPSEAHRACGGRYSIQMLVLRCGAVGKEG